MRDGQHNDLPQNELTQFEQDLRDEAEAHQLTVTIAVSPSAENGRVDVRWTVAPRNTVGSMAAAMAGAAATVMMAPAMAMVGAAAGAVAGSGAAFVLGGLSARFEARGPGDVSNGTGDPGGVSYGSWQLTSQPHGGRVAEFVGAADNPFAPIFRDLVPGTPPFSSAWRTLAATQPARFEAVQHEFIKRTHYDPAVTSIRTHAGIEPARRSHVFQDCLWSTAVQMGPGTSIPAAACAVARQVAAPEAGAAFDEAFIDAVYRERGRVDGNGTLVNFQHVSANMVAGLKQRFVEERAEALRRLSAEQAQAA